MVVETLRWFGKEICQTTLFISNDAGWHCAVDRATRKKGVAEESDFFGVDFSLRSK